MRTLSHRRAAPRTMSLGELDLELASARRSSCRSRPRRAPRAAPPGARARGSAAPRSRRSRCSALPSASQILRAAAARDEARRAADGAERAHGPVHAAGDALPRAREQLLRCVLHALSLDATDSQASAVGRRSALGQSGLALASARCARSARFGLARAVAALPAPRRRARRAARPRRPSRLGRGPSARTPCVARPIVEMPETRQRSTLPPSVISMTSSSSTTCATPTTVAVPLAGADRDDALAAAVLDAVVLERRALAVAVLADGEDRRAGRQDLHADDASSPAQATCRARPSAARPIGAHLVLVEADRLAARRGDDHLLAAAGARGARSARRPSSRLIAMMPPRRGFEYASSARLLDHAAGACADHDVLVGASSKLAHRQRRLHALAFAELEQVHERLAARGAPELRQLVDLLPVHAARGW